MNIARSARTIGLALIGCLIGAVSFIAYESSSFSQSFHISQLLSTGGSKLAEAQCMDTSAQTASSDIFFVSCGGIY